MKGLQTVSLWHAVNWLAYEDFEAGKAPDDSDVKLKKAQRQLYEALRDGVIEATGGSPDGSNARLAIPASFWHSRTQIGWGENTACFVSYQDVDYFEIDSYKKITLERRAITKKWPPHSSRKSGRGRPTTFDEPEFLRLCVWEVSQNGLPGKQAELTRRMQDLLSALWPSAPEDTWFKDKVRLIYEQESSFKKGRKTLAPKKSV